MNELLLYARLGFKHIIDLGGADHMLFLLALTIRFLWQDWKKLIVLVTAFTIGHSITLALSTFQWFSFSVNLIEMLIPVTILATAVSNFWVNEFTFKAKFSLIYFMAAFFGLIHGLGFSNYLKSLLGQESSLIIPLFSFNLGLELGQLLIVGVILIFSFIFVDLFKVPRKMYLRIGSTVSIALSLQMVIERLILNF